MGIEFQCDCGRVIRTSSGNAGRRGKCPACGEIVTIPKPVEVAPVQTEPEPFVVDDTGEIPLAAPRTPAYRSSSVYVPSKRDAPVALPPRRAISPAPMLAPASKSRGYLYLALVLLLAPLAWSTVHAQDDEFGDHLKLTVTNHPELRDKLVAALSSDTATDEDVFAAIPADKLDGALLTKHTWAHWGLAALTAACFFGLVLGLFPWGYARPHHMMLIGLFTGTAGIFLLLALQWIAFRMPLFTGHGWITLLLDLVWLIGQSYKLALTDHGFLVSFLGFTAGVGFCEEACKALPLIFLARRGIGSWRTAMLWGLLSGAGFGVSEAITYCSDYYNGICGPQIYAVRFISCVGLHAMWAAAVGITIFRKQEIFQEETHPLVWIFSTLQVVIVPMILHGLYDTLLKQKYDGYALAIAIVSFGWLAWQIERAKRDFDTAAVAIA
jgi:RsiW-degrading membrane proteinase PrsW (M82 family)